MQPKECKEQRGCWREKLFQCEAAPPRKICIETYLLYLTRCTEQCNKWKPRRMYMNVYECISSNVYECMNVYVLYINCICDMCMYRYMVYVMCICTKHQSQQGEFLRICTGWGAYPLNTKATKVPLRGSQAPTPQPQHRTWPQSTAPPAPILPQMPGQKPSSWTPRQAASSGIPRRWGHAAHHLLTICKCGSTLRSQGLLLARSP